MVLINDNFEIIALIFLPLSSILVYFLVRLWINYAIDNSLLDKPNIRSSHKMKTPIGGGLGVFITFTLILVFFFFNGYISLDYFLAFLSGSILVSVIGFLDDLYDLASSLRLITHFLACMLSLYFIGGFSSIEIYGAYIELGLFGNLLALFFLVWMINLYNFMDGINGIAGIEAVTVNFGAALLFFLIDSAFLNWYLPLFLGFSCLGFLFWNFPNAKIFLGDIGSGFLGFIVGLFAIVSSVENFDNFYAWIILLAVFISDATFTLIYRIYNREKFYLPHNNHVYQLLANKYSSHKIVSISIMFINILWLLPIAFLVINNILEGVIGVIVAYFPFLFLSIYYRLK